MSALPEGFVRIVSPRDPSQTWVVHESDVARYRDALVGVAPADAPAPAPPTAPAPAPTPASKPPEQRERRRRAR